MKPNFYKTIEEAKNHDLVKINTNTQYSDFNHTHYTAGTLDQFYKHLGRSLSKSADQTLKYIFYKFKKGIYVSIKNGILEAFLPFSNVNYKNDWYNKVDMPPNVRYVQKDKSKWVANGGLIRYEEKYFEFDSGIPNICDMFQTLCERRKVADTEFFINKRDFPILTNNNTEPYFHIYGKNYPLRGYNTKNFIKILSPVVIEGLSLDICMPNIEVWAEASLIEAKYFPHKHYTTEIGSVQDKIPTAIFRGSSTGIGNTELTNPRLHLARMSRNMEYTKDDKLLDAKITKYNTRYRKLEGIKMLQTIRANPELLGDRMTYEEQKGYKYIIIADGHSAPFRISSQMKLGSVLLIVDSSENYRSWVHKFINPWIHYIPVKSDLSDLLDIILWCQSNDDKCKEIINNMESLEFNVDIILDDLLKLI
jgi:hypothetical protein